MKSSRSLSMKSVVSLRSLDICNFIIPPKNRLVVHSIHKSINLKPPEICCLFCWVDSVKVQNKTSWLTAAKLSLPHTSEIHYPTQQSWKVDVTDSCQQYHRKTWFHPQKIGRGQSREWPWQSFQCAVMVWHPCCAKIGLLERTYL